MSTSTLPARSEIDTRYKWNLEGAYSEHALWEAEHDQVAPLLESVAAMQGKLGDSGQLLREALQVRDEIGRIVSRLCSYCRRPRDEDTTEIGRAAV